MGGQVQLPVERLAWSLGVNFTALNPCHHLLATAWRLGCPVRGCHGFPSPLTAHLSGGTVRRAGKRGPGVESLLLSSGRMGRGQGQIVTQPLG